MGFVFENDADMRIAQVYKHKSLTYVALKHPLMTTEVYSSNKFKVQL
jgi:hypothetical protein